jgi:pyruvate dehydrogenase E2 component (dihydrolipoamide acetyltransferase)
MGEFRMPSLGADMEAGTILEWRVQPGDTVHRGDIIAVVDTEKSTIEVEVFDDGVVEELIVEPGREVPVGTVLAHIQSTARAGPAPSTPPTRKRRSHAPSAPPLEVTIPGPGAAAVVPAALAAGPSAAFVRASPLARRRASERGVPLESLQGTGPGGAVIATDVDREVPQSRRVAAESVAAEPVAARRDGRSRQAAMRKAIGALMARSKREIPHYYLATTIDMSNAIRWMADINASRSVDQRLLPAAVLLKATALAARRVPCMNGFWVNDSFCAADAVHLGVAVSLRGGGLIAPAIHDADSLSLDALMAALRGVVLRARGGTLRSSEMADLTITVTNLGDQGVEEVFGVIYPPQVALVGFGKVTERPWADNGMLLVRPLVRVTLSGDHRASDGHDGARFLASIEDLVHKPEEL